MWFLEKSSISSPRVVSTTLPFTFSGSEASVSPIFMEPNIEGARISYHSFARQLSLFLGLAMLSHSFLWAFRL